jgi:hypothetical protein
MNGLSKIYNVITIGGLFLPAIICLLYWSVAAFSVGHFPLYSTDEQWLPFPNFRPFVDYSLVSMVFAFLGNVILLIISLFNKKWRLSKKQLIFGICSMALSFFLWYGGFAEWYLD